LLTNWEKEVAKFAPDLTTRVYHGQKRNWNPDCHLMITSYGILRSDLKQFEDQSWSVLIIDEAQNIKNPETDQARAVKKIRAGIKIAMTGTPVENRLSDYWSIMDFLNRGYLGSEKSFKREYSIPIQMYRDRDRADYFRRITSPLILRRLKSDKAIIQDLPDKVENDQYCSLTTNQTALYEEVVKTSLKEIKALKGMARSGMVFKLLIALKQICNHPHQFVKTGSTHADLSGKMVLLFSLLDNILESNEKTLIFTQYKEMGDLLVDLITKRYHTEPLFLHGSLSRPKRDEMVTAFQDDPQNKVFILSLKAGGTGLNLTGASNVIHYDLWWNPAVENQATDRAYRIGQTKNVMVYRLLTTGTMEERINNMIRSKKELADMTVNTGEKWIGELSNGELGELVELG
jgi:SNF2 family DNA or RNA helicase